MKERKASIIAMFLILLFLGGLFCMFYNYKLTQEEQKIQRGIVDISKEKLTNISNKEKDTTLIDENIILEDLDKKTFTETIQKASYGLLEIPSISVNASVTKGISNNVLRYFVGMYTTSDEPGTVNGNTALAAHSVIPNSGYCSYCYFDDIEKIKKGDMVYLTWIDGNKYQYEVYDIFDKKEKDSTYAYTTIDNESLLTLVTCSNGDSQYRTYVLAKLIKVERI